MKQIIIPQEKDLGEFSVRRALPFAKQKMVGPWIFFDHFGPVVFPAGSGVNVRPHPHINLATVTYLFEGTILHRDSLGSVQAIHPGDINLMVAGKGITHSEREAEEVTAVEHALHGLQLWLALPEADEEVEPAFYHYGSDDLPRITVIGVEVRVMIGHAYDVTSPVKTFAETLYLEAHLMPGDVLSLPASEQQAIYVASGAVTVGGEEVPQFGMAVLEDGASGTRVQADSESRIAIIGGEKMSKRFLEWNFVSSRKERIEQAKHDWKNGVFPNVPGDEEEFIPLPE